jgi:hypothetical protein
MRPISPLTCRVLAYQAVPRYNMDECVDWALEMIALGYEDESILILAGLSEPTNYFETLHYLEATIKELGLRTMIGDEGVISYSSYYISQIANGIEVKASLALTCDYMISIEYHESIYDFYKLHWAWDGVEYDGQQWYWDGATKDNIEQITINTAKQWLINNERLLSAIFS